MSGYNEDAPGYPACEHPDCGNAVPPHNIRIVGGGRHYCQACADECSRSDDEIKRPERQHHLLTAPVYEEYELTDAGHCWRLPDGSHAYEGDLTGERGLFRTAHVYYYAGPQLGDRVARTAPELLDGWHDMVVGYDDLVGFVN